MFATRLDLLARGSANRIAQLAVPTDMQMQPLDAVRAVLQGVDVASYPADQRPALAGALDKVDKALADADALIFSYGIPADVLTSLLARLASTVALFYLAGNKATKEETEAYQAALATLKAHARGEINLIPAAPDAPALESDLAIITSNPSRYGRSAPLEDA